MDNGRMNAHRAQSHTWDGNAERIGTMAEPMSAYAYLRVAFFRSNEKFHFRPNYVIVAETCFGGILCHGSWNLSVLFIFVDLIDAECN